MMASRADGAPQAAVVAPLEDLRQKFLHSANQATADQMLEEAEALAKEVTALGHWPHKRTFSIKSQLWHCRSSNSRIWSADRQI